MSEPIAAALAINLAAGAAVAVVLAARHPVRRAFGPRIAYALWTLPPLAALAMLAPAQVVRTPLPAEAAATVAVRAATLAPAAAEAPLAAPPSALLLVWTLGVILSLAELARRQARFLRAARAGAAGPAVVGVLNPRIVAPDDFEDRYSARERLVVMAHEETHLARRDARVNALMALVRCLAWFNPLIHAMAHYLRIDQELACDAEVVARHPGERKAYAEAMLKTQLAAQPLPFGCYWPSQGAHPLAERIRLLRAATPGPGRRLAGWLAVSALGLAAAGAAYAAKGPDVEFTALEVRLRQAETVAEAAPARALVRSREATFDALTPLAEAKRRAPAPRPAPPAAAAEPAPDYLPVPAPPGVMQLPPGYVLVPAAALNQPVVEPGYAVLLESVALAPDGRRLEAAHTSYGSGTGYRRGSYNNHGSRYGLRTKVVQSGEKVQVFVSLTWGGRVLGHGMANLVSGQTAELTLDNGQVVTVRPTIRLETQDEFATARLELRRIRP